MSPPLEQVFPVISAPAFTVHSPETDIPPPLPSQLYKKVKIKEVTTKNSKVFKDVLNKN